MPSPILNCGLVEGQRIGLFGGSFNPPHAGHLAIAQHALARLRLDRVWWLVSPQNPLKDPAESQDFGERFAATRALARNPGFVVSDIECRLGTSMTADTLAALTPLLARGRFVWILGADSFAGLDRWNRWREIPQTLPLAVFDRPRWSLRALTSPAAQAYGRYRVDAHDAPLLAGAAAPAWAFLTMPHRAESSTKLRNQASWPGQDT